MKYLSAAQILLIHSLVIEETGGSHGVRDKHSVFSLEQLPAQSFGGKELYPSPHKKAAVYARSIIMNHPFVDGNKRTGMTSASIFLENNDYQIVAKQGDIEKFALKVVVEKLDIDAIASWFEKNSKKV
jgi:death-on-curing protein